MSVFKKTPRVAGPQRDIYPVILTSTGASTPTITDNPGGCLTSATYSATGIYTLVFKEGFKLGHIQVSVGGALGITALPVVVSVTPSTRTVVITWYTTGTTAAAPASGTVLYLLNVARTAP